MKNKTFQNTKRDVTMVTVILKVYSFFSLIYFKTKSNLDKIIIMNMNAP